MTCLCNEWLQAGDLPRPRSGPDEGGEDLRGLQEVLHVAQEVGEELERDLHLLKFVQATQETNEERTKYKTLHQMNE